MPLIFYWNDEMKKGYFYTIVKNSVADTFYGLWYYFLYLLVIYHFLTQLVILPVFENFLIRKLLSLEMPVAVGSGYVIRFLLYSVILYLEFALYILISEKIYNNKQITIFTITRSLFGRFRFALSLSNWRIMIVFLLVFPFLNLPLTSTIINTLDISVTIREFIKNHHFLYALSILSLVILVYMSIKWSYALPYSVLQKKSIKESVPKAEKYFKSIFLFQVFLLFLLFSAGALIVQSEKWFLNDFLLMGFFDEGLIMNILKLFLIFLAVILSVIIIPFYFNLLTHLYHARKGDPGHAVDFKAMGKKRYGLVLIRNILLILFAIGFNFIGFFIFQDIDFTKSKVMVHRAGGDMVTENTAEAIEYAVSNQFDAIEIDIMETADGHFVLCHDFNIIRLTGHDKRINELTLSELKKIPIKGQTKTRFIGLEEALQIAKGKVLVNIELKTHGRESRAFLDKLYEIIKGVDMVEECLVSSFDYSALKYIEAQYEEIKTVLIGFYVPMPEKLVTDGLAVDLAYLTEDKAERIKAGGKLFLIWTVKDDSYRIIEAILFNSDYIITDYPEALHYINSGLKYFSSFMSMFQSDHSQRMEKEKIRFEPMNEIKKRADSPKDNEI